MEKLYTAEDLEIGKFYCKEYNKVCQLLEKTGKTVESYPDAFSNVYKFQIFNIESGNWWTQDVVLNPKFNCFTDVDKKRVEELIKDKSKHIESLKMLLK